MNKSLFINDKAIYQEASNASNTVTKFSLACTKLIITSTSDGAQCLIVSLV